MSSSRPKRQATKKQAIVELSTDDSEFSSDEENPLLAAVAPEKKQLGTKSGKLPLLKQEPYYKCGKCKRKASEASQYFWVYCPICLLMTHMHCIEKGCPCGFKPKPGQLNKKKNK